MTKALDTELENLHRDEEEPGMLADIIGDVELLKKSILDIDEMDDDDDHRVGLAVIDIK